MFRSILGKKPSTESKDTSIVGIESDQEELRILVWGLTGAGKSYFIRQCGATATCVQNENDGSKHETVIEPQVGSSVKSTTKDVAPFCFEHIYQGTTKRVILIDIPGFDDADKDAGQIFLQIALWLYTAHKYYGRKPWLHGTIFVHSLMESKSKNSVRQCFRLLELMCQEGGKENMLIVLSNADLAEEGSELAARFAETEDGLKASLFYAYTGRVMRKGKHGMDDGSECIRELWNAPPMVPHMLAELEAGTVLGKTAAGTFVDDEMLTPRKRKLEERLKKHAKGTIGFQTTSKKLVKVKQEQQVMFKLDKKAMDRAATSLHTAAGSVAAAGVGICATPLVVHVGLPVLCVAAFLEVVALALNMGSALIA